MIYYLLLALTNAADPIPLIIYGGVFNNGYENEIAQLRRVLTEEMGYESEDSIAFYGTDLAPGMPINSVGACEQIKQNQVFVDAPEFNVLGVSQGGLNARYVLEECDIGKVRNLITLGSPNMGVVSAGPDYPVPWILTRLLYIFSDWWIVQQIVAPASYFRDTRSETTYQNYLKYAEFLPKLNNEVDHTSAEAQQRRQRITELNNYLAVCFDQDGVVVPKESSIYSDLAVPETDGAERQLIPMEETELYKNDYIGLKELHEKGKLTIVHIDNYHVTFSDDDIRNIMVPILKS